MSKRLFERARPGLAVLGLAVMVANGPARAADTVLEDPPVPTAPEEPLPLATWTSVYGGVVAGYAFGETDVGAASIDNEGLINGAFLGVQFQSGSLVYGGETDIGYNWTDDANAGVNVEMGLEGSARLRFGYVVMQDVLIYGTGGFAAGKMEVTNAAGSEFNTVYGWTAGAGVDARLTEHIFGRLEYRYTDFANETFNPGGGGAVNVDSSHNRLLLGLGLHF